MRPTSQLILGRLSISAKRPGAKPQLGGKRPPQDPRNPAHSPSLSQGASVRRQRVRRLLPIMAAGAVTAGSAAVAQTAGSSLPDLSGMYRCQGDAIACNQSGTILTVTQSGSDLQIKTEKGDLGTAKLTSNISISAGPIWNMNGVITTPDNRVIQWSNGTTWRKQ